MSLLPAWRKSGTCQHFHGPIGPPSFHPHGSIQRASAGIFANSLTCSNLLDCWELKASWPAVSADGMRALAFAFSTARADEEPVGALVVFQAVDACEASADERTQLQEARQALTAMGITSPAHASLRAGGWSGK